MRYKLVINRPTFNMNKSNKINNYINHVVFVLDESSSMSSLRSDTVKVFDSQVEYLAKRSKELDQETRVSVYLFSDDVRCLIYDKDVLRLPSIEEYYDPNGNTALIDGTLKAIGDLSKTPELYGDHAYLIYVLSDGQENRSVNPIANLKKAIQNSSDNWTLAALVPNKYAVEDAQRCGFPVNNIQIWEVSKRGAEKVSDTITQATAAFMQARSAGLRSTKNLFNLNVNALNTKSIKKNLVELPATSYDIFPVHKKAVIKPFVESWTSKPYRVGSTYYQLTKPEKVQSYKQICLQEKISGKVFSGEKTREMLGLPDYEVKIDPASHPKYDLFLQSTSTNRNLVPGTKLIFIK